MAKNKFSFEIFLEPLHSDLEKNLREITEVNERNSNKVIELVRLTTEALVWSEQNQCNYFDYFEENDIQRHFCNLLKTHTPKELLIELIQTANILAHNLEDYKSKCKAYTDFLINSQFYSEIIVYSYDFSDEEIVENYVSLIKGLAINLSSELLTEFLLYREFSLFEGARMFLFYQEPMTRTASRTVILTVLREKNERILRYILSSDLIPGLIKTMKEKYYELKEIINEETSLEKLDSIVSDEIDNIFYINDIFMEGVEEISHFLGDCLLKQIILPVIVGSLASDHYFDYHLSIPLACYLIVHYIKTIKFQPVIDTIISVLLSEQIKPELLQIILSEPLENQAPSSLLTDSLLLGVEMVSELELEENSLVPNQTRKFLFSFLRSRDDNLINLTLSIMHSIAWSPSGSEVLIKKLGLLPQTFIRSEKLEDSLLNQKEEIDNSYDSEVVELLTNLMCVDPPLRIITCQLIGKFLMDLTYIQNSSRCLEETHEISLLKAFGRAVVSLSSIIQKDYLSDIILECFEEEWERVSRITFKEKPLFPSHLLIPMIEEFSEDVPLDQRRSLTEFESIRCETFLFFFYRKLLHFLSKLEHFQEKINIYPFSEEKETPNWRIDEVHSVEGKVCVRCLLNDVSEISYFIEDEDLFILVVPDLERFNTVKVTHVTSLRNVEAMNDRNDQKTLVVSIKRKRDSYEVSLTFEENSSCEWVKQTLENRRKASKNKEIGIIRRYLEEVNPFNK